MHRVVNLTAVLAIAVLSTLGCSRGSVDPVKPGDVEQPTVELASSSGRELLGVWRVHIDPHSSSAAVLPMRTASSHHNVLPQLDLDISYDPVTGYNWWFSTWELSIELENNWDRPLADVRGIFFLDSDEDGGSPPPSPGDILGIHNADARTTLWDDEGYIPEFGNPFKYYGDLFIGQSASRDHYLDFQPNEEPAIDCDECRHPGPEPPDVPQPQTIDAIFAVDASYEEGILYTQCWEPYEICNFWHTMISLGPNPELVRVYVDVHDHQDDVAAVFLRTPQIPGLDDVVLHPLIDDTWTGQFFYAGGSHNAIYDATVEAISPVPSHSAGETYSNTDRLYRDVKFRIGDSNSMLYQLFMPVGQWEVNAVLADWEQRASDWEVEGYQVVSTHVPNIPNPPTYYWIHHTVQTESGPFIHNGAVRVPPQNQSVPPGGFPVLFYMHFGDFVCGTPSLLEGNNNNGDGIPPAFPPDLKNHYIHVMPVYRGNYLCWLDDSDPDWPDEEWEEMNSPANWDVDDALVLLEAFLADTGVGETFEKANPDKIFVMGGSRGGTPSYLAKIRDNIQQDYLGGHPPRLDGAIIMVGSVVDFFHERIRDATEAYLDVGYRPYDPDPNHFEQNYFNEDYTLFTLGINPYLKGDMTLAEVRRRMLLSSPIYFVGDAGANIAKSQVHHGTIDPMVRVSQSDALDDLGLGEDVLDYRRWQGWGHWFAGESLYQDAVEGFLDDLWD